MCDRRRDRASGRSGRGTISGSRASRTSRWASDASPPSIRIRPSTNPRASIKRDGSRGMGQSAPVEWFELAMSLFLILLSAELFTNGIEWVGESFGLSEGAVGSVLAAVGTALPETLLPLVAILLGHGTSGEDIGIGAILGAPFM